MVKCDLFSDTDWRWQYQYSNNGIYRSSSSDHKLPIRSTGMAAKLPTSWSCGSGSKILGRIYKEPWKKAETGNIHSSTSVLFRILHWRYGLPVRRRGFDSLTCVYTACLIFLCNTYNEEAVWKPSWSLFQHFAERS